MTTVKRLFREFMEAYFAVTLSDDFFEDKYRIYIWQIILALLLFLIAVGLATWMGAA